MDDSQKTLGVLFDIVTVLTHYYKFLPIIGRKSELNNWIVEGHTIFFIIVWEERLINNYQQGFILFLHVCIVKVVVVLKTKRLHGFYTERKKLS